MSSVKAASSADVVVVGGGVIGLSVAYELLKSGLSVTVLDRGPEPGAASWAGAGILSTPAAHPDETDPVACLSDLGARTHATWAIELKEQTGLDTGYRRTGGLDLALDSEMLAVLEHSSRYWNQVGIAHEWVEPAKITQREPALEVPTLGAVSLPDRAQLRNPWHLRALRAACAKLGGQVLQGEEVVAIERSGDRIDAVATAATRYPAAEVVLAAGTWTGSLGRLCNLAFETTPVLGQIVLLRTRRGLVRHIVEAGIRYLVPREDGLVLVGSTEENRGFDATTTADGVQSLIAFATRLCPRLAEASLVTAWAGLRPGSRDGRPILGRAENWRNLTMATGHFRSGVQLSPATALVISDLIQGRAPRIAIDALRPGEARSVSKPGHQPFRS
jgi:glycine oxidase